MATNRSLDVLRVIVQDYVASREPVGSKTIVERHSFGVSAATIRNDMALLEEEELITAPHTSSGRIPTDKGYRVFVDRLADLRPLSTAQRQAIETFLGSSEDLDEVLVRSVRLLSQLTHQVALIQYPSLSRILIRHIEVVSLGGPRLLIVVISDNGRVEQRQIELSADLDESAIAMIREKFNSTLVGLTFPEAVSAVAGLEDSFPPAMRSAVLELVTALKDQLDLNRNDRLLMAGSANLALTAEDFGGKIHPVLEAIEEQVTILKLFAEMEPDHTGFAVSIGKENDQFGLGGTSVLSTGYTAARGEVSKVGVLGPTRMDYSGNMAVVRAVARYLSRLLGED